MHRPGPRPRRTRGRLRPRTPPSRTPRHLTCRVSVSVLLVVTWTSSDALPLAKPDPVGGARPPRCCHDVFVADGVTVCGHRAGGWLLSRRLSDDGPFTSSPTCVGMAFWTRPAWAPWWAAATAQKSADCPYGPQRSRKYWMILSACSWLIS